MPAALSPATAGAEGERGDAIKPEPLVHHGRQWFGETRRRGTGTCSAYSRQTLCRWELGARLAFWPKFDDVDAAISFPSSRLRASRWPKDCPPRLEPRPRRRRSCGGRG